MASRRKSKRGLYANIQAKRKRIAAGSGEKMRKKGSKNAPSSGDFAKSEKTAKRSKSKKSEKKRSSKAGGKAKANAKKKSEKRRQRAKGKRAGKDSKSNNPTKSKKATWPMPRIKRIRIGLLGAAGVASAAVLYFAGHTALHLYRSLQLAKGSQPFQTEGNAGGPRVLIVGDSTGEGTGASSPERSLAGLLAQRVSGLAIVNRSKVGARFAEFADQIPASERFDAILVFGGGNDIIRFTRAAKLQEGVARVADKARSNAEIVVFVPPGNVGNAPFFLPPWRLLMTWRATRLHEIVAAVAQRRNSRDVRLYKERHEDPFAQQPERMNAEDGLHPSDAGYAIWMSELAHQTDLITLLSEQRRTS